MSTCAVPLDKVLARLSRVKRVGVNRWDAACPTCQSRKGRPIVVRMLADHRIQLTPFCGCDKGDVLSSVGLHFSDLRPERVQSFRPEQSLDWSAKAEYIWKRTIAVQGTIGQAYLQHRCCALPPLYSDLRFLPRDDRYPPTLCGLVTDAKTAKPISLHFTKLAADGCGKAGTEHDKILLAGHRKAGGVIRLYPNEAVSYGLGIGEGIETCLAAAWGYTPMWSAIDAGNLAALPVLSGIEALTIFADHDAAGLRAAAVCADRWAAVAEVRVVRPDRPGTDMADAVAA